MDDCLGSSDANLYVSMSEEQCRPQSQAARKPVSRSVPICLGVAGALWARGGGGGAWHSVRGGAPLGFATQAGQGVNGSAWRRP